MSNTRTAEDIAFRPETFRLPRPGESDPFWGFSRSFYYALDKRFLAERGEKLLIHICAPGKLRGVTVIPFKAIESFVRAQMEKQSGGIEGQNRVHAKGKESIRTRNGGEVRTAR
jgi:hypothetical protein